MNQRAFNLFTALLAFILIILSVLLTTAMANTERQTLDTITGIQSRGQLQAVADLARADAIQVFNFGLRDRIEDWLADRGRGQFPLPHEDTTWKELQQQYAEARFGGENSLEFANFASGTLTAMFYSPDQFGNYSVRLENQSSFRDVLAKTIKKSVESKKFFEVVDCDMGLHQGDPAECKSGTFYVTLAIAELDFEDYEKLPRIVVRNKANGDELKEIILPRANFRIFVPIRVFKALAEARALTHRPGVELNSAEDDGVFSARVHNQIDLMALGMCDPNICAPRTNPFVPPQTDRIINNVCPGYIQANSDESSLPVNITCAGTSSSFCTNATYDAWEKNQMESVLERMVANGLCSRLNNLRSEFLNSDDLFKLETGALGISGGLLPCNGIRIDVSAKAEISKGISAVTRSPDPTPAGGYAGNVDPTSCTYDNPGQRVALFKDADGKTAVPNIPRSAGLCAGGGGNNGQSHCAEIKSTTMTFLFREINPVYKVNKKRDLVFEIKLYDNRYTGFAPAFSSGDVVACYVGQPAPSTCTTAGGGAWHCANVTGISAPGSADLQSCEPA